MKKRIIAVLLCVSMVFGMTGCMGTQDTGAGTETLPKNADDEVLDGTHMDENKVEPSTEGQYTVGVKETVDLTADVPEPEFDIAYTDELPINPVAKFGWEMLQETEKEAQGENVLISPMSAFIALQMTALGAKDKTKEQMTEVLHTTLNHYVHDLAVNLPKGKGYEVYMANSIWFKDTGDIKVQERFLQFGKDAFDASVYKAPFDASTLQDINRWVEENTGGKIENILDKISEDAVLYLINALSFDAEWEKIYKETEVWRDVFTKEDGTEQLVDMLHSSESNYLENEQVTGFIKYYKDRKYAFVALLPKEGLTVSDCIKELTGEELAELLRNPKEIKTDVTMPKFSTEYSVLLNDVLIQMGMEQAFHENKADFSAMAESMNGNIYINRVLQKTFLAVDERGTSAGAATVVEMANYTMVLTDRKEVNLNRPFIYMVVECEYNEPLFVGTMMDVEK